MQLPAMLATRAAAWACLIKLVSSSPTISFPFNAQVPPVARIASTFSFVLADNTFMPGSPTVSSTSASSSAASMTYTLDDSAPTWLSIDSAERWLHGTPQDGDVPAGDVVGINFGIVATDDTGSTTMNVTLVVSRNAAPTVEIPIAQQLAESGLPYSEPSSILSYPDTYFNFSFSQSTFSSSGLNYYAVSGDNSPLPSWIAFDANQIMFSGTTPPSDSLVEPPQTFNFQLIASDVTGFSAASIGFSVVVGSREITADDPSVVLNATVGKELVYDGLQQGIRIDGQVAGPSNLTAKVLSGSSPPDWLTFDTDTWELSGTPPSSAQNSAFSISFSDHLADAVNVTFQVDIDENGTVFRDTLPAMQAQRGSEFRLDLGPYLAQTTGVTVSVETDPNEDWISFDNSTFIVSGDVPISETASSISISVRATLDSSKATESETFLLQIMPGTSSNNSTTSSTTATSSPTSTTSTAAAPTSSSSTSTQTILLAVLIPTLLLAFVLTIVACCYLRRRRQKKRELSQHLTNKDISDPVPFSFAYNGQDDIGSSMRALDKEYKVSNLNKAYKAQQIQQEKAKLQATAEEIPVGTALTISGDEGDSSDQSQDAMMTRAGIAGAAGIAGMAAVASTRHNDDSDIPDFPAPPSIHTVGMSSSPSSSAGSARSNRAIAAANGQWPFEASTIISSVHSRHSSADTHAHSNASEMSHPVDDDQQRDALGILGSIASSSLSKKNSGSVLTRQTVRTSTPMQLDIAVQAAEASRANSAAGGRLLSEHIFASQEAIVSEGRDSMGTVIVGNGKGNHQHHHSHGDGRSSMQAVVDGTRSTLETNDAMENGTAGQNEGTTRGFFTGFASKIANSFKKSVPKARSAMKRFSTHGASSYPSPDAASFDTDIGSVTIGNITTAQPYKPRPVFIGSINRINEESPQPGSARWTRGSKPGSRASGAVNSRNGGGVRPGSQAASHANSHAASQANASRIAVVDQRHDGYNPMDDSDDDDDDYDGESILNGSDFAADEAIRLDPPRPAFLGPSNAERSTSDLSQEIASSLSSRRPTSDSSGMSGISAAMEEVRSLLLLPTDSPVSGRSQDSRQQMRRDSDDGLYAPSSNSWETLPSSEPNWTSLYEYVLPGQRSAGGPHATAAPATVTDASSNEPPTPATGVGLPYAFARPTQIHTGSPGSAAQHQAQARARAAQAQAQAQQQGATAKAVMSSPRHDDAASPRTAAYLTPETQLYREPGSSGSSNDDDDLALNGRGYRHPSSYYGESPYAITDNDYEYPPPFISGDGAYHDQDGDVQGDGGVNGSGSGASIGMAMSKYAKSQPMTQASLVSAASSGVRAFI